MAPSLTAQRSSSFFRRSETLLSVALLGVLVVMLVPLPSVLLDMLLATNLGLTIVLLLVTLSVRKPLEVSVFPSLLLLLTLLRLSLNVATTRLILLDGSAGKIVATFGGVVVGGNLVVGLVIFLILVIVQFIVITKGAGRVSEVAARFTLDALPGKQMAIDAELNSGALTDEAARARRAELARETEFYGAMDGASKFVRGDAIAGLVVTAINLVGGMILGIFNGLSFADAAKMYSILTIGDGLISQIPALIIATAAGILVTKSTSEESLGGEIRGQLFMRPAPLMTAAGILLLLSLTPGLPKLTFLALAGGIYLLGSRIKPAGETKPEPTSETDAEKFKEEELVDHFVIHDRACVEVGARLVPLVESKGGRGLAERIPKLRREMTRQHGIWIPSIRIRDNINLGSEQYRILLNGRTVASGELRPDQFLVINPGDARKMLGGEMTTDPTFGIPSMWIPASKRQRAELSGLTVVDAMSVLITHLGEVLRRYAHELLSREDLRQLLEHVRATAPTIVDELKPELLRVGVLHQVLINLLREGVPVSDLTRILECALGHATHTKDPGEIAELLRKDLGRSICEPYRGSSGDVRVIVLAPRLQAEMRQSLHQNEIAMTQQHLEKFLAALQHEVGRAEMQGTRVALLTDDTLRRPVRSLLERFLPDLAVLAFREIPADIKIEQQGLIDLGDVYPPSVPEARSPAARTTSTATSDPTRPRPGTSGNRDRGQAPVAATF